MGCGASTPTISPEERVASAGEPMGDDEVTTIFHYLHGLH